MSFKETEASVRYEIINGKKTAIITPRMYCNIDKH